MISVHSQKTYHSLAGSVMGCNGIAGRSLKSYPAGMPASGSLEENKENERSTS
jgi:hypothetical protein